MIADSRTAELGGISTEPHERCVALQARTYTHPLLGDRKVVRLVRENLAEVEDLSLEVLQFQVARASIDVGYTRNRAIGFPAWPIIHDPKNAHHAINLVQDLRRAAKLARSSPGDTKTQLEALAARLGDSAPHFLPTFLEEAARVFLNQENATYAAQFFSKAREAERVHNLIVDEGRHREAFLEFALAGALSAKELTNESKALLERTSAEEALSIFCSLNRDRVKGGLPPYANLGADLRRLIKAARANQVEVETGFLSSILDVPVTQKAPIGFWKTFLPALARLANRDKLVRDSLLHVVPESVNSDAWMDVLDKVGIVAELRDGSLDAAEWATTYIRHLQMQWDAGYPRALSALLRECHTLRGASIVLGDQIRSLEPDVVDALLEVGAKVIFEDGVKYYRGMRLAGWAEEPDRSDLTYLAAESELAALIDDIPAVLSKSNGLQTLLSHAGSREILARWAVSGLPSDPTLAQATSELDRLAPLCTPEGYSAVGAALEVLFSIDGADLLAGQLRHGMLTELTWPMLEATAARLASQSGCPTTDVAAHASWPAVGVSCGGHVAFVDGTQVLVEASFSPAKKVTGWSFLLIDDVVACAVQTDDWNSYVMWSNDPASMQPKKYQFESHGQSFPVPGGRLITSGMERVGATTQRYTWQGNLLNEGGHYWLRDGEWREMDPETGQLGRASLPPRLAALVAEHMRAGYELVAATWCPATPTTTDSLLSTVAGWHGSVNLRKSYDDYLWFDENTPAISTNSMDDLVQGKLRRPGGGFWLVADESLCTPAGSPVADAWDAYECRHLLHRVPVCGWHQYRVRDETVSTRLRTMSAEQVAGLLEVVPAAAPSQSDVRMDDAARTVAEQILGTTDPALVTATCWLAARTKHWCRQLAEIRAKATGIGAEGTFSNWNASRTVLHFVERVWEQDDRGSTMALGEVARGGHIQDQPHSGSLAVAASHPEVLLALAACPMRPIERIQEAAAAYGAALDAGLCTPSTTAFQFPVDDYNEVEASVKTATGIAVVTGYHSGHGFGISPQGEVPPRVGQRVTESYLSPSAGLPASTLIESFDKLLADGPPPWDLANAQRLAEGTGWSLAVAKVFLSGAEGLHSWEKNYLPKDLRELLGLKVAEASAAQAFLKALSTNLVWELLIAGSRDPRAVVSRGLDIDAIVSRWHELKPVSLQLDEELLSELDKLGFGHDVSQLMSLEDGNLGNEAESLGNLIPLLLWLAASLRRDDPARPWIGEQLNTIRKQFAGFEREFIAWGAKPLNALGFNRGDDVGHESGGWMIVTKPAPNGSNFHRINWAMRRVPDWDAEQSTLDIIDEKLPEFELSSLRLYLALHLGNLDSVISDLADGGVGFGQDPLCTVPGVVAAVEKALNLPTDAARYWLQILALPNPTDKLVERWNDWKVADRKAAAERLVARNLLVESKRSRAGRSVFLPGGWQEASAPHLPMEVWKAPFFDLRNSLKVSPKHQVVVPLTSLGQLFTEAWERYQEGDVPGYTELRTTRYRRRGR